MFTIILPSLAGGEDDDHRGGDLCPLLAALPRLLHCDGAQQASEQVEVHPAGVPVRAVAGHELHHVQPHHLLLPEQQVGHTSRSPLKVTPQGSRSHLKVTPQGHTSRSPLKVTPQGHTSRSHLKVTPQGHLSRSPLKVTPQGHPSMEGYRADHNTLNVLLRIQLRHRCVDQESLHVLLHASFCVRTL